SVLRLSCCPSAPARRSLVRGRADFDRAAPCQSDLSALPAPCFVKTRTCLSPVYDRQDRRARICAEAQDLSFRVPLLARRRHFHGVTTVDPVESSFPAPCQPLECHASQWPSPPGALDRYADPCSPPLRPLPCRLRVPRSALV